MKVLNRILLTLVVLAAGTLGFVYSGVYNIAADAPHTAPVSWLLHETYEQSLARRSADIVLPDDLKSPTRLPAGAEDYGEMCAGCHLAPGMENTPLRQGLNPTPPDLAANASELDARETFWIIKHGSKMTGMPAWGKTHSDTIIWNIVAIVQRLPNLSPDEYRELVKSGESDHEGDHHMGDSDHDHEHEAEEPMHQ
jgi:mono/diheme cytochrome c family protein